jgi:pyruvate kinase
MDSQRQHLRKTKIIVTLGSSSSDVETLKALILGGMDMARISDRFVTDKTTVLSNLKTAIRETGVTVGVMLGLRESDMRISSLTPSEAVKLKEGQRIHLATNPAHQPTECTLYCNNKEFPSLVKPGDKLLIDFGKVVLTVLSFECNLGGEVAEETAKRAWGVKKHNIIYKLNSPALPRQEEQQPSAETPPESSSKPIHKKSFPPIARIQRTPKQQKQEVIVVCRVEHNCVLVNSKPLHISPYDSRPQPISYSNDVEDIKNLRWAADNEVDVVVFKQIRETSDFVTYAGAEYRRFIGIQNRDSIEVSRELVSITDGCVIGRGMLALETSFSEVCRVQKDVTAYCNVQGKPMIISTQILESMCTNSVPSRSEVNDISNAVLDGCDALLLSGETAYGRSPLLALNTCAQICWETEQSSEYSRVSRAMMENCAVKLNVTDNICYCAVQSVFNIDAVVIICISEKGRSAQLLSKYKPPCPILALTNNLRTLKYLRIVRGVIPALMQDLTGDFFSKAIQKARELNLAKPNDYVVCIGGGCDSLDSGETLRISKLRDLIP